MTEQNEYVIGIEISNGFANIGYYDCSKSESIIIDTSFGYGKASFPTVIHYLENSDEWIFGEFALNNDIYEDTVVFDDVLNLLENKSGYIDVEVKIISVTEILSKFFQELLSCFHNVNPTGIISQINLYYESRNTYNIENQNLVRQAFEHLNIDKDTIKIVTLPQIIINKYKTDVDKELKEYLWIDSQMCYVANITKTDELTYKNTINNFEAINSKWFEDKFYSLLLIVYLSKTNSNINEITDNIKWKIKALTYNYKDLIINKFQNKQDVKVYYNFTYPAFEGIVKYSEIEDIIDEFNELALQLKIDLNNEIVVCVTGFEIDFLKKINNEKILFHQLNLLNELITFDVKIQNFKIIDKDTWDFDIGVFVNKNDNSIFVPIITKGSLKNANCTSKSFYYKNKEPATIELYYSYDNEIHNILSTILLPSLDEFTNITRVKIEISYSCDDLILVTIDDCGFGEIFPSNGYHKELTFSMP